MAERVAEEPRVMAPVPRYQGAERQRLGEEDRTTRTDERRTGKEPAILAKSLRREKTTRNCAEAAIMAAAWPSCG